MDDEVQKRLAAVMDYLGTVAQDADAFARAEIPELAKELIRWEIVSHAFTAVALLLCAVAGAVAVAGVFRKALSIIKANEGKKYTDQNEGYFPLFIVPAVVAVPTAIALWNSGAETRAAIKPAIAPRVFLVEWVARQVR